ncbi:MAG: hypothetical protein L0I93_07735 [Atopostipes suicloacalis]|nr:hypothetical protein [Atopostipes suicloacalis]
MRTVKQAADELNVSKQTVRNNIPEDVELKKIKNAFYIEDEIFEIAKENIESRNIKQNAKPNESEMENEFLEERCHLLEMENNFLKEQLAGRDKQIHEMQETIKTTNELLRNQQILALNNEKPKLTNEPKKKSLLQLIFGKN